LHRHGNRFVVESTQTDISKYMGHAMK